MRQFNGGLFNHCVHLSSAEQRGKVAEKRTGELEKEVAQFRQTVHTGGRPL